MTSERDERRMRRAVTAGGGPDDDRRRTRGLTFHDVALGEAGTVQGRFASVAKTQVTSGVFEYPKLPASSPWSTNPLPEEPPLGFDVNALEPTGTAAEIEQSMAARRHPRNAGRKR